MSPLPKAIADARAQWKWSGQRRPPFAVVPGPGQVSVWDFPRPPRLEVDAREVVVRWGATEVARTSRAIRVLETAHPPSFYIPLADVAGHLLRPATGTSFCEWKGPARYWDLADGERCLPRVGWGYPHPLAGAESIANCIAFYPSQLDCRVGGQIVVAQPGGFYGGWITPELAGPFKGDPATAGW